MPKSSLRIIKKTNMKTLTILLHTLTLLFINSICFGQTTVLKQEIETIIANKDLKLGFALYDFSSNQATSIHGRERFPMQSVFKFPISVALLDCVSKGEFSLNDTVHMVKADLSPDLWSPIRERWPNGVRLPLLDVLTYMVAHSDNSATDFLIHKIGGVERIQLIINRLGANKINIRNTEKEIQSTWSIQFDNWTTPEAMIHFLRLMNQGKLLNKENTDILWRIMSKSSTGAIKKLVPQTATFARKTGYSGVNKDGVIAAQNDVGIIEYEDGRRVAYAIFLTDSAIGTDEGYEIIAQIGKAIWKAYDR